MINTPIQVLIWNFLSIASAGPLRNYIESVSKTFGENVDLEAKIPDFFIPEAGAIDHDLMPGKNGVHAARPRRDVEMEDFGIENVSFEVPTIMKVNDTHNEDAQLNFLYPAGNGQPVSFNQGNSMQCLPQNPNPIPKPPITISMCIENILPPGKADKYIITNSSEIRGSGVMFKINICESRGARNPSDLVFSFDLSTPQAKTDKLESSNKKKTDDEEEDEESPDQKTLHDILRKILSGKYNSSTLPPEEMPTFIRNSSKEPFTLILNPSMLHKPAAKFDSTTSRRPSTFNKSPNPPDYDYLCKVVEQLSTSIPKQKLASLLSGLIAKAYPGKK